jgi:hypothetical protein
MIIKEELEVSATLVVIAMIVKPIIIFLTLDKSKYLVVKNQSSQILVSFLDSKQMCNKAH